MIPPNKFHYKTKQTITFYPALFAIAAVLAVFLTAINAGAIQITNEFWVSTNAATSNLGTLDQPFDGSTQPNFDSVLDNLPENSTLHILAGTYQTHGVQIRSGIKLLGSGIDVTVLQFPNGTADNTTMILSVGQAGIATTNIEISDLTCDCNYTGGSYTYHGIILEGTMHTIRRVKLIHQAKSSPSNSESWGLVISNPILSNSDGNIIENCEVSHFSDGTQGGGFSALGFLGGGGVPMPKGVIRNNSVIGNSFNSTNSFVNAIFAASDSVIEGNYIANVLLATHSESGISNMLYINNTIKNAGLAIDLQAGAQYQNLTFAFNQIELTNAGAGAAFRFWQQSATNIVIFGNKVTVVLGAVSNFIIGGNVSGLTVAYNTIVPGMGNSFSSPVVNLNIDNNFDLFGNYLSYMNQPNYLYGGVNIAYGITSLSDYFFGGSGNLSMTGSGNTAAGYQALTADTTGGGLTAFGYQALQANTTGVFDEANGWDALSANTTGSYNAANGRGALANNTTGQQNTATGDGALYSNTVGNWNTANGATALYANTNGVNNVADGFVALYHNISGYGNIGLGAYGGFNITGNNNIDIGNQGVSTDNSIIRLGDPTSHTDTYLAGVIHAPANAIISGTLTVSNGIASTLSSTLPATPASISSSPFFWTNTTPQNLVVYINGVNGSVGYNGSLLFGPISGAPATVILQPGSYVSVTNSTGTPVLNWHPL